MIKREEVIDILMIKCPHGNRECATCNITADAIMALIQADQEQCRELVEKSIAYDAVFTGRSAEYHAWKAVVDKFLPPPSISDRLKALADEIPSSGAFVKKLRALADEVEALEDKHND